MKFYHILCLFFLGVLLFYIINQLNKRKCLCRPFYCDLKEANFGDFLEDVAGHVEDGFHDVEHGVDDVVDEVEDVADDVVDEVEDVADDVVDEVEDVADDVVSYVNEAGETIELGLDEAGNLVDSAGNVINTSIDEAGNLVDELGHIIEEAPQAIGDFLTAVLNAPGDLVDYLQDPQNKTRFRIWLREQRENGGLGPIGDMWNELRTHRGENADEFAVYLMNMTLHLGVALIPVNVALGSGLEGTYYAASGKDFSEGASQGYDTSIGNKLETVGNIATKAGTAFGEFATGSTDL